MRDRSKVILVFREKPKEQTEIKQEIGIEKKESQKENENGNQLASPQSSPYLKVPKIGLNFIATAYQNSLHFRQ